MLLLVHQLVQDYLPAKRRQSQKGWHIFNSPCCSHRGHNADTRGRGNLLFLNDGSMIFNCYNCGYKTAFRGSISTGFENWLEWLGAPRDRIQQAKLEILSKKLNGELEISDNSYVVPIDNFKEIEMPYDAKPISHWIGSGNIPKDLSICIDYISNRGRAISTGYNYYWTKNVSHNLNKRVLIPFYYQNKIIGYTGRYAGIPPSGVPKYWNSDLPNGYLFNNRVINIKTRKYILILEGPFDAIAVDGVGVLGSTMNNAQITWLNSIDKEKIVVPDRQRKNQDLIDTALEHGWSVSFPDWPDNIKDAADASLYFGKLYTLASIITHKTHVQLEVNLKRKLLKG